MPLMNTPTTRQMLTEIKSALGLGEIALAKNLDISQPTVNRILNGQPDCKGTTFRAIVSLYEQVMASRAAA